MYYATLIKGASYYAFGQRFCYTKNVRLQNENINIYEKRLVSGT